MTQWVTVLGSTGSIGTSTLDVISRHPDRYQVYALSAHSQSDKLFKQCLQHHPRYAVLIDDAAAQSLAQKLGAAGLQTEVLCGPEALCEVARAPLVDVVMAAIVGAAGLESTLSAVTAGKRVLLANKETLVMAGGFVMDLVRQHGAVLLPIDSEHNAMFQCMPSNFGEGLGHCGVRRILLTASGGPFRTRALDQLHAVTVEQACAHPNWSMGRKISVDSASMMNKGLELIEACWLFGTTPDAIDVVVHPQSIIHSMVEYVDGSVLAQLGNPDMRTPIAYGLAWPERIHAGVGSLDVIATARLDFEAPDELRFPCLRLAREAYKQGGTATAILNAANEEAVAAFLDRKLRFTDIPRIIEHTLEQVVSSDPRDLDVVRAADREARHVANRYIADLH